MMKNNAENSAHEVIDLVNDLLHKAAEAKATDIHFEPTQAALVVKYRLDGQLQVVERLPRTVADNVISRLKVLAGLLTYRTDIPQEGRIVSSDEGAVTDQRLAVFPTIHGQRAVVRLFYQHSGLQEIDQLGLTPSILKLLEGFISGTQGILLLTGPAGSGKSTTLAALMRRILARYPGRSVVTVEDPVEIHINGATQVQITPHGEMTFPTALRSLLRQDPEVLMLGEIRDAETARIAIEAGLTGHLLASTMHSGSPAGALVRLLEMGVEPYQVTSSVTAVINQRLVRRLCDHCKVEEQGEYRVVGCDACLGTGYKGRVLLADALAMTSSIRQALLKKTDINTLMKLQPPTFERMAQDFLTQGISSREELTSLLQQTL